MSIGNSTNRYLQSEQSKGEQCLVDLAYHDASTVVPMTDIAIMRQGSPHPPGKHAEASSPDDKDGRVEDKIETRIEATQQVESNGSS